MYNCANLLLYSFYTESSFLLLFILHFISLVNTIMCMNQINNNNEEVRDAISMKEGSWREHGGVANNQKITRLTGNNAVLWVSNYSEQNSNIIQLKSRTSMATRRLCQA